MSLADPRTGVQDRLRPFTSASYDSEASPAGCYEGTRAAIHEQLSAWANDGASVLSTTWLSGMAGTGKTAIASTFARNMEDQGILGATFFLDRQQAERRDLRRIIQTLAYDLVKQDHKRLQAIWTLLVDDPTFEQLSYQEQARLLIQVPLNVGRPDRLVVVIDGLDELGASEGASLLATLAESLVHHPIKLFVTSRNEAHITNSLRGIPHTPIELHEFDASGDIRLYWEHNLDALCHRLHLSDWRSMVILDELVELSENLFIHATSVFEIIQSTRSNPIQRLQNLIDISRSGFGSAVAFIGPDRRSPLENMYTDILSEAVKDHRGHISTASALQLHDILEVVIFAREGLTLEVLSDLLEMDKNELEAYLSPLSSVLVLPDGASPDDVIRPLHSSFLYFVLHQGHLVHPKLAFDSVIAQKNIVERCIRQLNKHLHTNICRIQDPSLFNVEVPDLDILLNQHVTAALRYSCRFWVTHYLEHIRAAGSNAQLPHGMDQFCKEHLLHWIEVLSLTGDMNTVPRLMPELISVIHVRSLTHNTYLGV
jgi:hypothetical protein